MRLAEVLKNVISQIPLGVLGGEVKYLFVRKIARALVDRLRTQASSKYNKVDNYDEYRKYRFVFSGNYGWPFIAMIQYEM
jgi:hypothetical protein